MTIKITNDCLVASIMKLSHYVVIKALQIGCITIIMPFIVIRFVNIWDTAVCTSTFSVICVLA